MKYHPPRYLRNWAWISKNPRAKLHPFTKNYPFELGFISPAADSSSPARGFLISPAWQVASSPKIRSLPNLRSLN
ncbi:hypothetical protein Dimus_029459 [Dionaea muscipula]